MRKNNDERRQVSLEISRNLRKLMFEREVTRKGLSELSGISRAAIDNYLVGRVEPGAWSVVKLDEALGCTADRLLGLEDRCRH